jgi:hypothetical protein
MEIGEEIYSAVNVLKSKVKKLKRHEQLVERKFKMEMCPRETTGFSRFIQE